MDVFPIMGKKRTVIPRRKPPDAEASAASVQGDLFQAAAEASGTQIHIRRGVALCQLLLVCGPGQGQDGSGQGFGLGLVHAHQNEFAVRRQQSAEGDEIN